MSEPDVFQQIQQLATSAGLDFLLIGGHAVNAHGYARTTLDVDILAREKQRAEWLVALAQVGYRLIHETSAFAQFDPPNAAGMELDMMLVDEATFAKLEVEKKMLAVGGAVLPVTGILHLIALKLHATRTWSRAVEGKDFYDVVNLVRVHQIDVESILFQEIIQRYASESIHQRLREELARSTS